MSKTICASARTARRGLCALICCLVVAACSGSRPAPAPPEDLHGVATVPGFPGARVWGDVPPADVENRLDLFTRQIRAQAARTGALPGGGRMDALILSGGGSDGAFGAGFLVGWTETGTRPEFTLVTGISAGAFIAPFAFLGPDYDHVLRDFIYRDQSGLVSLSVVSGLLDGSGLVDTSGLRQVLRTTITPEVVRRLAQEHDKGRRLIIGTTDLDAERPVYWRVDLIAKLGADRPEETARLIADIIYASGAIPGAFAPQYFLVEAGGRTYSEMHVDGGVANQLFLFPDGDLAFRTLPPDILRFVRRGTIYVIRNAKLAARYDPVEPSIFQVASRSLSAALKFGSRNDIRLIEQVQRSQRFGLRLTAVPASFDVEETEFLDPAYGQALFQLGREMAGSENSWYLSLEPALTSR